ncbi:retrotransposon protein, putative, ty1-copia subclass [Tanacetum coccineum]
MDNFIYSLDGYVVASELKASVEEKYSLAQVWHKRLEHISEAGLHVLEKQGLFGKKSLGKLDFCENYVLGKSYREGMGLYRQEFGELCVESGIARHLSVIEMSQQNGLAKCMNITLMDMEDGDDEDARDQDTDQTPDPIDYQLVWDREQRTRTKPLRFRDESNMATYVFELVDHPARQKLMSCKWLFKIKEAIEGVQKPRVILALTACKDYELERLDVKMVFSHENLEEVIYMRQPPGYEQGNKVCLLKKSLSVLKQSPRQWYRRFDDYMLSNRFKRSSYDSCAYYRSYAPGEYIYLLLYVDDMLIAYKRKAEIGSTKSLLKNEFDMKELGEAKKILGIEIVKDRSRKILRVSQSGYVSKILNNFRIDNGKSVQMPLGGHFKLSLKDCPVRDCDVERMSKVPYANAVGSLMYLIVSTRPDRAYAVSVVRIYIANLGKNHWEAVKWILKNLQSTTNVGLVYGTNRGNHVDVTSFVDSDYAKDPDKGRSIIGYAFLVQGCVVSCKAMLQYVVALSTTEAEYMALTEAVKTKHINVRYHFMREVLESKTVKVLKVDTEHNVVDALTNVVPGRKLQHRL